MMTSVCQVHTIQQILDIVLISTNQAAVQTAKRIRNLYEDINRVFNLISYVVRLILLIESCHYFI